MAFHLLFLFSFVHESEVFHEDEVSSLNKLEGVYAQKHSFMKATYCRKHGKYRFETDEIYIQLWSSGLTNPAAITNEDAYDLPPCLR